MSTDTSPQQHTYIAIDLKSFYASVECVLRGMNPLTTNLVVADPTRTEKTIVLAVSPSLKAYGIPGRPRLFEVVERVHEINIQRRHRAPNETFQGSSSDAPTLEAHPEMELAYIVAPPQMRRYMEFSTNIFHIYMRYVAPEDIHVYSVDEIFADVTHYLNTYHMTAHELTMTMIHDVLNETGITATAGIGTNMYLCKIAMDIVAKHMEPDADGVRIAELDEMSYRQLLWSHRPITDFWRIGHGLSRRLEKHGLYTMGDIARCSIGSKSDFYNEDLLYNMFGINAELLIDHAWGYESATIADIKAYRPQSRSISEGQVLPRPYAHEEGGLIVREMTDQLVLKMVEKGIMTDQMVLTVGYDVENIINDERRNRYRGEIKTDYYGREVPKHAHGTANLERYTSSSRIIIDAVAGLYERITEPDLLIRRISVAACRVKTQRSVSDTPKPEYEQMDLFTDYAKRSADEAAREQELEKERRLQEAVLSIKKKYGKNAVLKGMNLEEGATARERNAQVGGHKA